MNEKITGVPRIRMLTDEALEKIVNAALEVLETQGSIIEHKEAKDMLLNAGATKGTDGKILIPASLVKDCIESAPSSFILYDRDGNEKIHMGGYESAFGSCCDTVDMMDPYTGERRAFESSDWKYIAKCSDYLPNIDFMHLCGNASDIPGTQAYRDTIYEAFANCRKVIALAMGSETAVEEGIEVAEIIAGGADNFKEKPICFALSEPTSPLSHAADSIGRILVCAKHECPVVYYGMQMQGVSAPATGAGTVVISVAETLTGLTIHQLKKKGAPFIFGGIPAIMDMRSMTYSYGTPEMARNIIAYTEVAHYLDLPSWATSAANAFLPDAQAGTEFAITSLIAMLTGGNLVHDLASLDCALLTSCECLVLNDEIAGYCKGIVRDFIVDEETLAVDLIGKVGAAGSFLGEKQTAKKCKEFWKPSIFERAASYQQLEPLDIRLNKKVKEILDTHVVPQLSDDVQASLAELKASWDEKLK